MSPRNGSDEQIELPATNNQVWDDEAEVLVEEEIEYLDGSGKRIWIKFPILLLFQILLLKS